MDILDAAAMKVCPSTGPQARRSSAPPVSSADLAPGTPAIVPLSRRWWGADGSDDGTA